MTLHRARTFEANCDGSDMHSARAANRLDRLAADMPRRHQRTQDQKDTDANPRSLPDWPTPERSLRLVSRIAGTRRQAGHGWRPRPRCGGVRGHRICRTTGGQLPGPSRTGWAAYRPRRAIRGPAGSGADGRGGYDLAVGPGGFDGGSFSRTARERCSRRREHGWPVPPARARPSRGVREGGHSLCRSCR